MVRLKKQLEVRHNTFEVNLFFEVPQIVYPLKSPFNFCLIEIDPFCFAFPLIVQTF